MKYEYMEDDFLSIDDINLYAQEGWELVAAVNSMVLRVPIFYFKRKIK